MKNTITLILGLVLFTSSMFGQAKFYTNNGKTLVKELKAVLPIPEEFQTMLFIYC
jgi:hypothetical protein